MKKKLMMVAVLLGALSLGACVDDNESASVTNIRNAKAEQLTALAEKARAEGEAAKIKAEAEAALLEAQAAYQAEMTEEARQKFLVDIERIKAEAEAAIAQAKLNAQRYEQQLLDEANDHIVSLYTSYKNAVNDLNELQDLKLNAQFDLAGMQAGLGTVKGYAEAFVAQKQAEITKYTAEKEAWKNYSGLNANDLNAQLEALNQKLYTAQATQEKAEDDRDAKQIKAEEILAAYDVETENSSVAAITAIQNYAEENLWSGAVSYDDYLMNRVLTINVGLYDNGSALSYDHALSIYFGGYRYIIDPISIETIELSEETGLDWNASTVKKYSLDKEAKAILDQYYSDKRALEDALGHKADANQIATGLYEALANAEELAATSKKAYDDAVAKIASLESTVASAEKLIDEAEKTLEAAKADVKAKDEAFNKAKAAEAAVKADPDATPVEIEQAELNTAVAEADLNLAIATEEQAEKNLQKVQADNATALQEYYNLKNSLDGLQVAAEKDLAAVASWNSMIDNQIKSIENFDTNAALWAELTKAIEADEYATAVEALKKNTDVIAYVESEATLKEAEDAVEAVIAEQSVIEDLLGSAQDPEAEIAELERLIAEAQLAIDRVNENILYQIGAGESIAYMEKMIAEYEAEIEKLDEQIAAQEGVVEVRKAALEAAINSQDGTEDTPAEEETPAA